MCETATIRSSGKGVDGFWEEVDVTEIYSVVIRYTLNTFLWLISTLDDGAKVDRVWLRSATVCRCVRFARSGRSRGIYAGSVVWAWVMPCDTPLLSVRNSRELSPWPEVHRYAQYHFPGLTRSMGEARTGVWWGVGDHVRSLLAVCTTRARKGGSDRFCSWSDSGRRAVVERSMTAFFSPFCLSCKQDPGRERVTGFF